MRLHNGTPPGVNSNSNDAGLTVSLEKTPDHKVNGHKHRRRRRIRNGQRLAALRALTAAQLYLDYEDWNLAMAATACGSCVPYVQAMLIVVASENITLLQHVLAGEVSVLVAASEMSRLAKLIAAYRTANADDRAAFDRTVGTTITAGKPPAAAKSPMAAL